MEVKNRIGEFGETIYLLAHMWSAIAYSVALTKRCFVQYLAEDRVTV